MININNIIQKGNITRAKLEIFSIIVVLVCALSVFTVTFSSQTSLTYDQGRIRYTGYVVNHRMNGEGKLVFPNGDTYIGSFRNGVFEGEGTFTASTGWSYKGQFHKGQANGKGVLKAKNAKVYKGTFKQGIFQK
ncbi:MORN repeat-containing protein [Streptococcus castoreus]|uniref:MORN repeat-containing protein n=1 Tax=Streptococcus castoreus TaxID=254786 RepID=UPI000425F810|nr:MORN repeat-containing protein [Streptococcus castoreus]